MTVSTCDSRVGPSDARKLAGRLESVGAEVRYLEEREGGNGVSDAPKHPDLKAMRLAFLFSRLTMGNRNARGPRSASFVLSAS